MFQNRGVSSKLESWRHVSRHLLHCLSKAMGIKVVTDAFFTVKGSLQRLSICSQQVVNTQINYDHGEGCSYSFWIRIDEAPPPPLQMPASPYWPDFRLCTMWPTILDPDILQGEKKSSTNCNLDNFLYRHWHSSLLITFQCKCAWRDTMIFCFKEK